MNMIECKCTYCNEIFLKKINEYNSSKEHFCSSPCYQSHKKFNSPLKNKIKCYCSNCNEEIYRTPFDIKRNERLYCDRNCMIEHRRNIKFYEGNNNANFKGGDVEVECSICSKKIIINQSKYNYKIKKNRKFYCSKECEKQGKKLIVWRDSRIDMVCDHCGEVFNTWESQRTRRFKFCSVSCRIKYFVGDKASSWKGGVHSLQGLIRNTDEYILWRTSVYNKDNFTCADCGTHRDLNAHHKKRLSIIIEENNVSTIPEAMNRKKIWDINNGITLCLSCHAKRHSADRLGGRMSSKKGRRAA